MLSPISITTTALFCLSAWIQLTVAAAGGLAAGGGDQGVLADTQSPTTTTAPSLVIVGSSTTVTYGLYTISFTSPLTKWVTPTPGSGTIGLGTIQGAVGKVKTASS